MPITAQNAAVRLLRDFGITSLDPANPTKQPFPIELPGDIDDVLGVMNAANQIMFRREPNEERGQNLGTVLRGPTTVAFDATNGSTAIANFGAYASWMLGCTVRIGGDDQDNEITSASLLARPYIGTTGTQKSATVYNDSVQLDATVGNVLSPVSLPNQVPMTCCTDRQTFMRMAGYPLVCDPNGTAYGYPWFWFVRKNVSRPIAWYLEPAYTAGLNYVPRRIRVAPMPDQTYSLGYFASANPSRLLLTDLVPSGYLTNPSTNTDPGTLIPVSDDMIESIYLPICRKILSGKPQFKNEGCLPQIAADYKEAIAAIDNTSGMIATKQAIYL